MIDETYPKQDPIGFLIDANAASEAQIRLSLFQAVSKAVNSSLILEEIFDSLGDVLRTFIPFEAGSIVILDESQNSAKVVVSLDETGHAEIRGENNFVGYDAIIDDLLKRPYSKLLTRPFSQSVLTEADSEQAMLVPLISKGVVIGCIGLSGASYTAKQLQLLEEVSEQLAVAVENARLYWQTQSQAGREFLINQLTKAIRKSLDIHTILGTTVDEIGRVMGLSRCIISYWGSDGEPFAHFEYALSGVKPLTDPEAFAAFERELFMRRTNAFDRFNPFILNDCRQLPGADEGLLAETRSLAVFPILIEDTTFVGTISLHQNDAFRAWVAEEIDLLMTIAEHVSVALHQANLFREKENQRQQLEDTLAELQTMQMHLIQSEKMAVIGQFVAGIAHEVNTPLGTMTANDDTVRHCLEQIPVTEPRAAKFRDSALALLGINRMASERIQEIVRNLKNFVRLDESDLKTVDLHEGIESTLLLINSSLPPNVRVLREYGDLPRVECFPGLLNQVFMNLVVNALHSLEGAAGTLTIRTAYEADAHRVRVSVSDTGKGIPESNLSRIFDPGFTTKGVGVGTGLGLALCYRIVEKHAGDITVQSALGEGTTMTVSLPVASAARA